MPTLPERTDNPLHLLSGSRALQLMYREHVPNASDTIGSVLELFEIKVCSFHAGPHPTYFHISALQPLCPQESYQRHLQSLRKIGGREPTSTSCGLFTRSSTISFNTFLREPSKRREEYPKLARVYTLMSRVLIPLRSSRVMPLDRVLDSGSEQAKIEAKLKDSSTYDYVEDFDPRYTSEVLSPPDGGPARPERAFRSIQLESVNPTHSWTHHTRIPLAFL